MFRVLCLVLLLFSCSHTRAQIELSGGVELSYPQLLTPAKTMITAGQISSGLRVGVAFRPAEAQLYPEAIISCGNVRLPLQYGGRHVASVNCYYAGAMLNENLVIAFTRSRLLIHGGIGFIHLINRGIAPSGNDATMAFIDSTANIRNTAPALNAGCAYSHGEYLHKAFYWTVGINIQYTAFLKGKNTYYVSVTENGRAMYNYESSLTGGLITPGVYLVVHYRVRKNKSSMYLQ